jgi:hypothetical protein
LATIRADRLWERTRNGIIRPRAAARPSRDKNGEVSKKHGNTPIGTLRKTYASHFAPGCRDDEELGDVLHKLDEPSLARLVRDTPGA